MPEQHNLHLGIRRQQFGIASGGKRGHALNRHGDVVFDVCTQAALRGGNVFAQRPQIGALLLRLRQHGVFVA